MRVSVCIYLHTHIPVYVGIWKDIRRSEESKHILFVSLCVCALYINLHAYVKINKIQINQVSQLNAIHALGVQVTYLYPPVAAPTILQMCLYGSRADKTQWANVSFYSLVPGYFSSKEIFFSLQL